MTGITKTVYTHLKNIDLVRNRHPSDHQTLLRQAVKQPEIISVGPEIISVGPEIISGGPEIISGGPKIIWVGPEIISVGPKIISVGPEINRLNFNVTF